MTKSAKQIIDRSSYFRHQTLEYINVAKWPYCSINLAHKDYITQIQDAFPSDSRLNDEKRANRQTDNQNLVEPLTARELEVLALLVQRMINKEIAAQPDWAEWPSLFCKERGLPARQRTGMSSVPGLIRYFDAYRFLLN